MNGSRKTEHLPARGPSNGQSGSWQDLPEAVKYGDFCYQAERYGDALESYLSVMESTPRNALSAEVRARLQYRIACCYHLRNNYRKALDHLDLARQELPRHIGSVQLAKIYCRRGQIMAGMGQYDRAERYLRWAKKLLSRTHEHEELADIEVRLGVVYYRQGRHQEATQCYLSALATYRRIGDPAGEAKSLNNLGIMYKNSCQWREAVHYLEQSRVLAERVGLHNQLITSNLNLGIAHYKMGKWDLSDENLAVAERLAREFGSTLSLVRIELARGNIELRRHRWQAAEERYRNAFRTSETEGYARESVLAREFLGELYLARGEFDRAAEALEEALPDARKLAAEGDAVDEILRRLAETRIEQGRHRDAIELCREALDLIEKNGDRYERPLCVRALGLAHLHLGEEETGRKLVEESIEALGEFGDPYQKGWTHFLYGRFLADRAVSSGSLESLEAAAVELQRAYGTFLDLDARITAASAAYERAVLESKFQRLEEAASFRARSHQILPPGADPVLETRLDRLASDLERAFTERWSSGADVLTSLREMKRLFQGARGTEGVLEELTRLAVTRSRSSRGCVATLGEKGGVKVAATFGWSDREARTLLGLLESSLSVAVEENRPLWSNNAAEDSRFRKLAEDPRFRTRNLVLLPLTLTDDRPGFLYVDKTRDSVEDVYHEGELHLLTILANLAALSIVERWNSQLADENRALRAQMGIDNQDRFVTASPELKETLRLAGKVANSPVSILIEGETGTGKGLLAQVIHSASNRRDKPFVQINCAALPEQLLESELFGHVKGAFTGATYTKTGLFKEAERGTLFLDEVDKTSPSVQAKLLHVMDSKEVRPVGAVKSYQVDTRVICATNTDLRERIKGGEFLEDLYYRLNDFILRVPPLRDRREDVPLLLDYFLEKFCEQYDRPRVKLSGEVRRILIDQPWRGNVRELEKAVRRLVVLADEDVPVGVDLLPVELQTPDHGPVGATLRDEVAKTERRVIAEALRANGGNKAQVARDLKISYPCLLKKVKEYGLAKPRSGS